MRNITVSVKGSYASAHVPGTEHRLSVRHEDGYTTFVLPAMADYEVVALDE